MATISERVLIDILEKKLDGTFKQKYPTTRDDAVIVGSRNLRQEILRIESEIAAASKVDSVNGKVGNVVINVGDIAELNNTELALGLNASAPSSSFGGIAIGSGSQSIGAGGVVLGQRASAGLLGVAIGDGAVANGMSSIAIGSRVTASNNQEAILGGRTNYWTVPGSLSVSGTKNFEIPHPKPEKKDTHIIRHGAVESPSAGDTLYRYTVKSTKENDMQIINLPDYFVHLNKDVQVFVTPKGHFGNGYGILNREKEQLEIHCQNEGEYNVLVIGTRNDDHESIQNWDIKGVEREVGESWDGETYIFEDSEIILEDEYLEEVI